MAFSLEALEYDRCKKLLEPYVGSRQGRELLQKLKPGTDRRSIENTHDRNREAMAYLSEHRVAFSDIPLLESVLGRLNLAGITLTIHEVESVGEFMSQTEAFRSRWDSGAGDHPLLAERARAFPHLESLRSLLIRAVRDGEINEDYSPKLKLQRRELEKARARLSRKLESILKSEEFSSQLQDQLVTIRNGRYVIPVRTEQKRRVEGIVHGMSSSGATVFMEPLQTLEMNNDIVRLEEEEAREIQRILGELTERIQESAEDLHAAARLRAELDLLFAVARFGRDFDCVSPRFSEGNLRLVAARHPLLEARYREEGGFSVPLTLEMDSSERSLVISGPNAGGKTVVLKTVGVLTLMAQSGIPVPAKDVELPIMDHVLADIGDQQSIANQLSTFSAHVLAISKMVVLASDRSLILMDEIGGSTEPTEGAALAEAVLDHFLKVGALTLATTHYNRLKMYAERTEGVRNAAMEFRESTLEPTYRLIDGLAGQSSGLKIAERLRLPADLIDRARDCLDRTELDAARYVDELKDRVANLERERNELRAQRRDFEEWESGMRVQLEDQRREELARMEARLDLIVAQMRERGARELKASGQAAQKRFERSMVRVRADAVAAVRREKQDQTARSDPSVDRPAAEPPQPGSRVRVISLGVEGSVAAVLGSEVEVRIGNMKARRPFDDVEVVDTPRVELPSNVEFDFSGKQLESNEINLIGCTAEEALVRLDKFLDDAFLSRLSSIRIVHGHGTGTLRRAVQDFLETHPHISDFEPAPRAQGGGVTLANLRD